MEVICTVDGCAAEIENIVAFNEEINVLQSDKLGIVIAAVDQVSAKLPFGTVIRADQREQIALCQRLIERI